MGKRQSNAPVSGSCVMKPWDELRNSGSGAADASKFAGNRAVGERVCGERFGAK